MFICAKGESFSFTREIGVGLVESASLLTSLILRENPKFLIFVGSAGSYDKDIGLFDIFTSCSATQIEYSFTQDKSYTPIDNKVEIVSYETSQILHKDSTKIICDSANQQSDTDSSDCDTIPHDSTKSQHIFKNALEAMRDFPSSIVNSSNYICTDILYAKQMKNVGITLENMEFFSVLKVAKYFKIPAFGIFCVTNYCDKNAHNDFLANHKNAQKALESNARRIYDKYF